VNTLLVPSRFSAEHGFKSAGWERYAAWNEVATTVGEAMALGATRGDIAYHAKLGNITLIDLSREFLAIFTYPIVFVSKNSCSKIRSKMILAFFLYLSGKPRVFRVFEETRGFVSSP